MSRNDLEDRVWQVKDRLVVLRFERDEQTKFGLRMAAIALIIVSIPLTLTTVVTRAQANVDFTIVSTVNQNWPPTEARVVDVQIERDGFDGIRSQRVGRVAVSRIAR